MPPREQPVATNHFIANCIESRDAFVQSLALLKRNAVAAPFERAFSSQKELEAAGSGEGELLQVSYRDQEQIFIRAAHDRVTVIFSTVFQEETDRIFGKVFLQVSLFDPLLFRLDQSCFY